MMPPAIRGIVSDALKSNWPSLLIYPETNKRDSSLLVQWSGNVYRVSATQVRSDVLIEVKL